MVPLNKRQSDILTLVRRHGKATVDELASLMATTPQTIRKDLRFLEAAGEIARYHGGASVRSGLEYMAYDIRQGIGAQAKAAIGAAAVRRLPTGASVFVNAGTTTEAAAHQMARNTRLSVITDNVHLADITRKIPGISTVVAGGEVRPSDGAVVGAAAVAFIEQFQTDFALIGAAAIAPDGTLLDYDLNEAMVVRAMMRRTRHVILLADQTKFTASAPVEIGHLRDVHCFITDRCSSADVRAVCEAQGVELIETARSAVRATA